MIRVRCKNCGSRIKAALEELVRGAKCPKCGHKFWSLGVRIKLNGKVI